MFCEALVITTYCGVLVITVQTYEKNIFFNNPLEATFYLPTNVVHRVSLLPKFFHTKSAELGI